MGEGHLFGSKEYRFGGASGTYPPNIMERVFGGAGVNLVLSKYLISNRVMLPFELHRSSGLLSPQST